MSRETPVDFHFIKKLAGIGNKLRMVDHETGINQKTTLNKIFGKADCVAILFHIIRNGKATPIGHWCLMIKGNRSPIRFFDSLGLGLNKIYKLTGETPYLLQLLKKKGRTAARNYRRRAATLKNAVALLACAPK